ncbi:hypothetical protein B6N60_03488 [Richelia sinica FACHB-800]|uniref:Uncharacterized protein n=1 Tax=Richelia sinica FACHB-800 TaxID=1357546 RepID=A0A975Y610_9NOST|nr:hypothetical protein B6N60_03488 [Richelia sinica FACHB-800]
MAYLICGLHFVDCPIFWVKLGGNDSGIDDLGLVWQSNDGMI